MDLGRDTAADAAGAGSTVARSALAALLTTLEAELVGRNPLVERLLIALLAGGHVLVEGSPGLAKTRAVKRLSERVDASFARIQCTPDLMPADLTGTPVWRPDRGVFEFVPGPVFHSLVLVDEINRAPPKVQSALLEAMAESQVTAGGTTHRLPDPFMVVATQNPIEHEGTFPLPEAQLDRFLFHVTVGFPDAVSERAILDLVEREEAAARGPKPSGDAVRLTLDDLHAARSEAMAVHLSPAVKDYIVRLVMATRDETGGAQRAAIEHPVSPRGTLSLAVASKARAYLRGRSYVNPDDVRELAADVLAHRLGLTWRAVAEGVTPRGLVAELVAGIAPL
ncbi:AAA family ATPase [Methylobrevis albus]|uniref:MoxR family ATPase n=1 Tax=Methylobrevis albus TaxID=2793297 RepID=A0A931I4Q8_9HYPH|nr:MoxR family ATPase [Methylobrevis albus]MBH0239253.1 MoxR family ATPase [Methylobrevis albus]